MPKCERCGIRIPGTRMKRTNGGVAKYCSRACYHPRSANGPLPKRSSRVYGLPGLSVAKMKQLLAQWREDSEPCAYCGHALADTVDHIRPLARGGSNEIENLAPACRACNSAKRDRLPIEWMTEVKSIRKYEFKEKVRNVKVAEPPKVYECGLCGDVIPYKGGKRSFAWCATCVPQINLMRSMQLSAERVWSRGFRQLDIR